MFNSYFDESQKQFYEWQKQYSEWQRKFFETWVQSYPAGKGGVDFSESFIKALGFQEELVRSYLDAQEKTAQMMLDAQKKFWDDYFNALKKAPTVVHDPSTYVGK